MACDSASPTAARAAGGAALRSQLLDVLAARTSAIPARVSGIGSPGGTTWQVARGVRLLTRCRFRWLARAVRGTKGNKWRGRRQRGPGVGTAPEGLSGGGSTERISRNAARTPLDRKSHSGRVAHTTGSPSYTSPTRQSTPLTAEHTMGALHCILLRLPLLLQPNLVPD